jgi:RecA/RadA recombinase
MPKKAGKKKAAKGAKAPKAKAPVKSAPSSGVKAWVEKINKSPHYRGKAQVTLANNMTSPYILRRPTGILGLDIALGGGLHASGGVEIHGEESVGKTHLAYRVAAMLQKNYGPEAAILIFSTEIKPDKGFARKSGVQMAYSEEEIEQYDRLRKARGMPGFTSEELDDLRLQTGEVVVLCASTADVGLDGIVDALRDGVFQLVIIESMGAFLTPDMDDKDTGERVYGGSSIVVTNFQNKIYPLFMMDRPDGTTLETTLIGVNQARSSMDAGKYAPKTRQAAGAFAWKHGQLASIMLNKSSKIRQADKGPVVGREVSWMLTKGKAGTHDGKKGKYDYYHVKPGDPVFWKDIEATWMGGVDVVREAVGVGVELGVIDLSGSWATFGDLRKQGQDNLAMEIAKEEEHQAALWKACMDEANLMVRHS